MERSFSAASCCICLLAILAGGQSSAPAAEPEKSGPKYNVTFDQHGKEVEKAFDPSQEADAAELNELLRHGEVSFLELEKPVNILALAWDLGLWTLVVFCLLYFVL